MFTVSIGKLNVTNLSESAQPGDGLGPEAVAEAFVDGDLDAEVEDGLDEGTDERHLRLEKVLEEVDGVAGFVFILRITF